MFEFPFNPSDTLRKKSALRLQLFGLIENPSALMDDALYHRYYSVLFNSHIFLFLFLSLALLGCWVLNRLRLVPGGLLWEVLNNPRKSKS